MPFHPPRRCGVSLVELLTVVGIVVVLAAIVTPVAMRAKSRSASATCLSNQMQVAKAIELYANDYDGLYNFSSEYFEDFWYGHVAAYSGGTLAGCPLFRKSSPGEFPRYGYVMNDCLKLNANGARDPSLTVLLAEATSNHSKVTENGELIVITLDAPDNVYYQRPVIASMYEAHLPYGAERHYGGSNYTLVDGHATWKRPTAVRLPDSPSCLDSPTTVWRGPANGLRYIP